MQATTSQSFDVIVVGGGSAGAVLATRLSEDHACQVLLLEAGVDYGASSRWPGFLRFGYGPGRYQDYSPQRFDDHTYSFLARATADAGDITVRAGKVLGGSGAINAQIFLRATREDFQEWVAAGNTAWGFPRVLPYFKRSETDADFSGPDHGDTGPMRVARFSRDQWLPDSDAFYESCRRHGFPDCPDHNAAGSSGVGPTPLANRDGLRGSTALAYLAAVRARPNLTILGQTQVQRVLFDGTRAIGVAARSAGQALRYHAPRIILACGAIHSPKLLLLSGVGSADELTALGIAPVTDLPGVGRGLRDHPQVHLTWLPQDHFPMSRTSPRFQTTLRYTSRDARQANDMLIHPATHSFGRRADQPHAATPTLRLAATLNHSQSAGSIRLRDASPDLDPIIDLGYFGDPTDLPRLCEAVDLCQQLAQDGGGRFRAILGPQLEPEPADLRDRRRLESWIRREVWTSYHLAGTCRMGPAGDREAVVSQQGAVHGVDGLSVMDASVMPTCIRANTNATTVMIAEYMADLLRGVALLPAQSPVPTA